jgi:hypothetical protein
MTPKCGSLRKDYPGDGVSISIVCFILFYREFFQSFLIKLVPLDGAALVVLVFSSELNLSECHLYKSPKLST